MLTARKCLVLAVLVALSMPACRTQARETTPEDSGASEQSTVSPALAAVPESRAPLDARDFLCELANEPENPEDPVESRSSLSVAARARARGIISRELVRMGLEPQELATSYGRMSMNLESGESSDESWIVTNLFAELPATVPSNEWIVVGAHYDAAPGSPGADDNGSGVTAVLLVAERLTQLTHRSAGVIFVFFDMEEDGLIGSEVFAGMYVRGRDLNMTSFHNLDMVGYDGDGDRVVELKTCTWAFPDDSGLAETNSGYYMALYLEAQESLLAAGEPAPSLLRPGSMCRSDHVSFSRWGIRSIHVAEEFNREDTSPHYHRRSDTCSNVDYDFLRMTARLTAEAVRIELQ